ncbi:hypothetical protein [Nesterenkonia muleiensis]|uniref:hypothetical protein n=1 Tax=Nesterenkonia muleiensis TaxID=2282648 RepID=UPI0013007384|nr:hypothetical protein [Nesterenkonia muleiensis]
MTVELTLSDRRIRWRKLGHHRWIQAPLLISVEVDDKLSIVKFLKERKASFLLVDFMNRQAFDAKPENTPGAYWTFDRAELDGPLRARTPLLFPRIREMEKVGVRTFEIRNNIYLKTYGNLDSRSISLCKKKVSCAPLFFDSFSFQTK